MAKVKIITIEEAISNWHYFCALSSQLAKTEQFVDHSVNENGEMINGNTFSWEFAKLLMLAAAEFENIAKSICIASNIKKGRDESINYFSDIILNKYPKIGETLVITSHMKTMPLRNWSVEHSVTEKGKPKIIAKGIEWWKDYNEVKHNRYKNYKLANLRNCFYAMSSLMVLELYLLRIVSGDMREVASLSCDYFESVYRGAVLTTKYMELPDFADSL